MSAQALTNLSHLIKQFEANLLNDWISEQLNAITLRKDLVSETELKQQSAEFLKLLQKVIESGSLTDISQSQWTEMRGFLENLSRSRSQKGFTTSETATFIFSFKQPFFKRIQQEIAPEELSNIIWQATIILDKLGLYTAEVFQKTRESIIKRQQEEMLELSTPVVKLWDGVLALPMIGTLDSNRTQIVMESLLQKIVDTGSEVAIIDITGVPNVDTLVAQHLLKTITAARLMGADCIISGIRPQIAQTIVHLGVSLEGIITKASLADAFRLALKMVGRDVSAV